MFACSLQELNKLSQLSKTAGLEAGRLAAQDPEGLELYGDVRGEWVLFRPSGWDESLGGGSPACVGGGGVNTGGGAVVTGK